MARRRGTGKAKVEKFHTEAQTEVYELLEKVVEDHHDSLGRTEFLVLMKHGGWKSKGKTMFGKAKVLGDDLRRSLKKDVILYLNADMWAVLAVPQKKYVLDHTLFSLDLKSDRHGDAKEAADGRPLLSTIPPDIEGFAAVIKRHGVIMEDVKRLSRALTEVNQDQMTIEEVAASTKESQPDTPVEEARGAINEDGSLALEEFDEKNQATIDEFVELED